MSRLRLLLLAIALPLLARAEIQYKVTPLPESNQLRVEITAPVDSSSEVSFQMPNWAPGSYRLVDHYDRVRDLKITDEIGNELAPTQPNKYTWTVPTAGKTTVKVAYLLASAVIDGAMHYSGPSTYMYVVGRKGEATKLEVALPAGWSIATGLDEDGSKTRFTAPDFDVLADNPVSLGDLLIDTYTLRGKPHFIVMRGAAKADVDRANLLKACRQVTESQADFFGGLPYNKYIWHFSVNDSPDGAGGLEHLSSTQIGLASGVGPRVVSVLSHEFFHLWNVKRIRSKALGPFDYTQLPKTGALWWLEGVDDYYANLLLFRYGAWSESQWHRSVVGNLSGVRGNPARMEISPHDASLRVGEAANGRGNSNGFRISYYNTGFLVGLCLDIEMRARTNGRRSLDDVMKALWQLCKGGKPGFEEDEIRKQLVRFGGPGMGDFYDRIVMTPGELPVEEQLAKVGLKLAQGPESFADHGILWFASKANGGARVRIAQGPAEGNLMPDDTILAINGRSTELKTNKDISLVMQAELDKAKMGQAIALKVKRGEATMDISVIPAAGTRTVWQITPLEDTPDQKRLRMGWYYAGKRKP
ncbi:MAG: hypothetical protein WAO58_09005 [Fimbriimonadaceae bacterium]